MSDVRDGSSVSLSLAIGIYDETMMTHPGMN